MSDNSASPPAAEVKPSRRRTAFMIEQENNRILDYARNGATDREIKQWLNLSDRNYRKRIYMIQKQDMKQTLNSQTIEARAFTLQRMLEKIYQLQIYAHQIVSSKTEHTKDRLEAMRLLEQLYDDEYSLKEYGPARFFLDTIHDPLYGRTGSRAALRYRAAFGESEKAEAEAESESDSSDDSESSTVF